MLELAAFAHCRLPNALVETELIRAAAGEVGATLGKLVTPEDRQDALAEIRHFMSERLGYRFRTPIHQRWRRIERRNTDLQWLERGVAQARKIEVRGPQLVCLAAFLPFLAPAACRELAEEPVPEVRSVLSDIALQFVVARVGPVLSPQSLARLADWLLSGPQLKSSVQCLATIVDQLEPAHARRIAASIISRSGWLFESEACLLAIDSFSGHLSDAEHPRLAAVAGKLRSPEERAVALVRVAVWPAPSRSHSGAACSRRRSGAMPDPETNDG